MPALADCTPGTAVAKPTSQYEIHGDEARDTKTRLTWKRCSVGQEWKAGEGCVGEVAIFSLTEAFLHNEPGWRLPTQKELDSLVSPTCMPAINEEVFPGLDADVLAYWSQTVDAKKRVWYINFADGSFRNYSGSLLRFAMRLVKDD